MLKSSSILINAARGGIIDEKALSKILHEGKIFIDLFFDFGGGATFLLSHSEFTASDDYAPGTNMKLSFAF